MFLELSAGRLERTGDRLLSPQKSVREFQISRREIRILGSEKFLVQMIKWKQESGNEISQPEIPDFRKHYVRRNFRCIAI